MRENLEKFQELIAVEDGMDMLDALQEAYQNVAACEEDAYKQLAFDIKELLNETVG